MKCVLIFRIVVSVFFVYFMEKMENTLLFFW